MAQRLAEVTERRLLEIVLDIASNSRSTSARLRAVRLLGEINNEARARRRDEARCPSCGEPWGGALSVDPGPEVVGRV